MNKTFVAELDNHVVYLITKDQLSFYVNVTKGPETTNITLDINTRKKNSLKDIIGYYEKIDNYNITLVVPLIKVSEDYNDFKMQSNVISCFINNSYKLLTENNVTVRNNINIVKHKSTRSDFVEFFLKQFSNRVRFITIDDLVHEEVPYNKINAANISFVIGKPELELTIKEEEMKEVIKNIETITESENSEVVKQKFTFATSGYVSYYLLGFLTAVVTLLVLTLLIK